MNIARYFGIASMFILAALSANGSQDFPPEWYGTRAVTKAILSHAAANESRLPDELNELNEGELSLPKGMTLDMFVYVAPKDATLDLPPETPLVLFPWEGGVYIGDMSGFSRFESGGYVNRSPREMRNRIGNYQTALALAVVIMICLIMALAFAITRSRPTILEAVTVLVIAMIVASFFTGRFPTIEL